MDAPSNIGDIAVQLQNLSAQEKLVLRLRFALDGSYNHTLQDIADGLKMSSERVREIEQGALLKLARAAVRPVQTSPVIGLAPRDHHQSKGE